MFYYRNLSMDKLNSTSNLLNKNSLFLEFLAKLKLEHKFPQKLSLRDAMTISAETLGNANTTDQFEILPLLILQKMMMSDRRCRSCLFQKKNMYKKRTKCKSLDDSDSDSDTA